MRHTAAHFVGLHDFQSFSDDDPEEKSTHVQVEGIDIREEGDLILVHVEGSHFLWKMVRRVVGVLVEVGRGTLPRDEAIALLKARSGLPARLTAPASGLFLERVYTPAIVARRRSRRSCSTGAPFPSIHEPQAHQSHTSLHARTFGHSLHVSPFALRR